MEKIKKEKTIKKTETQTCEHKKKKVTHALTHRPLSFLRRSLDKGTKVLSKL